MGFFGSLLALECWATNQRRPPPGPAGLHIRMREQGQGQRGKSRQDSSSELQTSRGGCDNDNALQPLLCRLPRPYHHSATIATDSHAVTAYQLYLYRGSTVFRSIPIAALNVAPYDACQQHPNFGHLPPSARRRRRHACPHDVPPAEQLTGLLSIRLRQ